MGSRKEYWCDLCDEHYEHAAFNLVGLRFSNNHDFTLGKPESTDGHHVCQRCLKQLVEQCPQHLDPPGSGSR